MIATLYNAKPRRELVGEMEEWRYVGVGAQCHDLLVVGHVIAYFAKAPTNECILALGSPTRRYPRNARTHGLSASILSLCISEAQIHSTTIELRNEESIDQLIRGNKVGLFHKTNDTPFCYYNCPYDLCHSVLVAHAHSILRLLSQRGLQQMVIF